MFSQLGPLFKTVFRAAEHADARLEIRREEKENGKKKDSETAEDSDPNLMWEDSTSVSVVALRSFLMEFLQKQNPDLSAAPLQTTRTDTPPLGTLIPEFEEPPPFQAARVTSAMAARAAKAYGASAEIMPSAAPILQPQDPMTTLSDADLLESAEIRLMHQLIKDLDVLARRGVESLIIQMNDTFLDSVHAAVRLQMDAPYTP